MSSQLISHWHFRETRRGPILPGRERGRPLSYMELIELAIVAVFRKVGLRSSTIRKAREYVAQNFNSEYPFAQHKFKTDGFDVLMELVESEPKSGVNKLIVTNKGGQVGWEPLMAEKLLEFEYEYDLAIRWHVAGEKSPIVIDPRIAFGAPMIKGIPTGVLKGRWVAGESIEDIQEDFQLEEEEIRQGLRFEEVKLAA